MDTRLTNIFSTKSKQLGVTALVAIVFLSCAIKQKNDSKKPKEDWDPNQGSATAFDFKKNCGLDDNAPEGSVVFTQNLKSLNFVVEAGMAAFKARVEAAAELSISSTESNGTQKIDVKVNKVVDLSNNPTAMKTLITKIGARIVAGSRGGTMVSNAVPQKDWLKLTDGGNPEFKGLLCAVPGEATLQKQEEPRKLYQFSPALVSSINPKASPEQRTKEIGAGRKFTIRATLINSFNKNELASTTGTVEIKPVGTSLKATDPLTNRVVNITADAAYEVLSNFSTAKGDFDDLSSKITFYLNDKEKKFFAITQEEVSKPGQTDMKMPVIIMLPQ